MTVCNSLQLLGELYTLERLGLADTFSQCTLACYVSRRCLAIDADSYSI